MEWIPLGQAINEFWNLEKRMPRVQKQTPTTENQTRIYKSNEGVLGRISRVVVKEGGIKFLVYGRAKTGKTWLGATFPKPVLVIGAAGYGTEDGTRSVAGVGGVYFVDLRSTADLEEICEGTLKDFSSYLLDTAGGYQERCINEYLGRDPSLRKDWRDVPKTEWGAINDRTIKGLHRLYSLADQYDKNVVIIAHERTYNEPPESDLIVPHIGASLTPGAAGWLNGAADYIGHTYIREQTKQTPVEISGKQTGEFLTEKTGAKEYCMRVGPHPVYMTGFRKHPKVTLPDSIVNPTYDKIVALIRGGRT